jgi:hypothetical protein
VNDVWVLTNSNGVGGTPTWIQLAPTGVAPNARHLHSATYDANSNRMVVFGGFDGHSALNDVWVSVTPMTLPGLCWPLISR